MMIEKIKAKIRGTLDLEKLKKDGLTVGVNFYPQQGTIIDPGHCWLITIGDNVTLAPNVHILAHDASTKRALGYTKLGLVTIGSDVFIGAGSIVLPGVTIADHVIIGAGSVVTKSLTEPGVYCGNPCVKIMDYESYIQKMRRNMDNARLYGEDYIIGRITEEKRQEMKKALESGMGFIV